jgi:hypothetical protein
MKIGNTSIWNIATRIPEIYGTLITIGLILYFFISYLLGVIHVIELRLLNLFILAAGIHFALKQYKRTHNGHVDYFHAFTIGMATTAIGVLTFSLFLLIYLFIDKQLMQAIAEQPLGYYLDPYIASLMVSLEGMFSGLFVTFLLANYVATRTPVSSMGGKGEIIQ